MKRSDYLRFAQHVAEIEEPEQKQLIRNFVIRVCQYNPNFDLDQFKEECDHVAICPLVINTGNVQCYVVRKAPHFMHHFGPMQYDRDLPILTDAIRSQAQPIIDCFNRGEITLDEATRMLDQI